MKDNALRIMLFLYILSGCLVVVESTIAAPAGIQLVDVNGQPVGPQLGHIWGQMQEHELAMQAAALANSTSIDPIQDAARSLELGLAMTVGLLKLLGGVYAFEVLGIFGVPWELTAVIQGAYVILLARALIGYMPAIAAAIRALVSLGRGAGSAASAVTGAVGGLRP